MSDEEFSHEIPPLDPSLLELIGEARREQPKDPAALEMRTLAALGLSSPPTPPEPPSTSSAEPPGSPHVPVSEIATQAPTVSGALGASATTGASVASLKAVWLVLAAASVIGAGAAISSTSPTSPSSQPVIGLSMSWAGPSASVDSAPSSVEPLRSSVVTADSTTVVRTGVLAPTSTTGPSTATSNDPQPSASAASSEATLTDELAEIEAARAALGSGQAGRALQLLDQYEKKYPKARFRSESTVVRIEALTATGRRAQAISLAKSYLAASPKSPYAQRLRSLLPETAPSPAATNSKDP